MFLCRLEFIKRAAFRDAGVAVTFARTISGVVELVVVERVVVNW